MKFVKRVLFVFLSLIILQAKGQNKYPFSDDKIQFMKDIHKEVKDRKKEEHSNIADYFREFWRADSLTEGDKDYFIKILKTCHDKKLPVIPFYTMNMELVRMIRSTTDIQQADMDTLMETTIKVLKNHRRNEIDKYYGTLMTFFVHDALYKTNYSSFYSSNGMMKITYVEEPIDEELILPEPEEEPVADAEEEDLNDFDDWDDEGEDWGSFDEEETFEEESLEEDENINEDILDVGFLVADVPVISGPVFEFINADFNLITRYDSVMIRNTNAKLLLTTGELVGEGGRFDWTSAGLDSSVFVELPQYVFDISKTGLKVEGVKLNYPSKLEQPIEGVFEFQSTAHDSTLSAKFPRFMSYKSDIKITDLGENIKYWGGFSLRGHKVYSSSVSGGSCLIEVYHENKKRFRTRAEFFVIVDSMITARPANMALYFEEDSLYHPGVRFSYNKSSNDLKIYKDKSGFKHAPFLDSYHEFEITIDALYWTIGDSTIAMTMQSAKSESPAYFESTENYQLKKYAQLQGLYRFHALQLIVNYSKKMDVTTFYAEDLAKKYKQISQANFESSLYGLMLYGYIDYNPKTGFVRMKEKAFHYVESRRSQKDYDNISFTSIDPEEYNAYLNLNNNELRVTGVDEMMISDSLNVTVFPKDREIVITKGRSMYFDGLVVTSNYLFTGREFTFNYDEYNIDLKHIDSLKFEIEVIDTATGESLGKKELDNQLNYSSGMLTIDKPNNKSTQERNAQFPHFDAVAGAQVYFNSKEVLNGVYDSTMYYKIPPFDIDSLGEDIDMLRFDGTFNSPMFPTFEEPLRVMEDKNFGFVHTVPEEGYPLYNGKGVFFGEIKLDGGGLRGNGRIEFLNTVLEGDDFVFFIDSVKTVGTKCVTKEGGHPDVNPEVTFPLQNVETYSLNWQVSKDSMNISNLDQPIKIFKEQQDFYGTLSLTTDKGMLGNGMYKTVESQTLSDHFEFNQNGYKSEYSQFSILTENDRPALQADFVKIDFSLVDRKAKFYPQEKGLASNKFPWLEYATSLNQGLWDMDAKKVFMERPEGAEKKTAYFYSTRPDQDSLVFSAEKAIYNIDSVYLKVEGVDSIAVADGQVLPHEGLITVRANAEMDTLHQAVIILDNENRYHRLYDGDIKIVSRGDFDGRALYQYINISNDTLAIAFTSFETEVFKGEKRKFMGEEHTVSSTSITIEDSLHLSDQIWYKGPVVMNAHKRGLIMDGWVKLDLHGKVKKDVWLKNLVTDEGHEVVVDLSKQNDTLYNGLIFNSSRDLENKFLSKSPKPDDQVVFEADGVIFYNKETDEFEVSTKAHLNKTSMCEPVFAYSEKEEEYRYEGILNLLKEEDKAHVEFDFSGTGFYSLDSNKYELDGIGILNFDIPDKAIDVMAEDLANLALVLGQMGGGVTVDDTLFHEIAFLAGEKAGQEYASYGGYTAFSRVDKVFTKGIVFSHLKMRWHPQLRTWYSVGELGISNINDVEINSGVEGYFEIKKARDGDEVTLYLKLNDATWYYISFKDNAIITAGTKGAFNAIIDDKSQAEKNEVSGDYFFASGSIIEVNKFLKYFSTTYLSGDGVLIELPEEVENFEDVYGDESDDELEISDDEEYDYEDSIDEEELDEPDDIDAVDESPIDENEIEEEELTEEEQVANEIDAYQEEMEGKKEKKKKKKAKKEEEDLIEEEQFEDEIEDAEELSIEEEEEAVEEEAEEMASEIDKYREEMNAKKEKKKKKKNKGE